MISFSCALTVLAEDGNRKLTVKPYEGITVSKYIFTERPQIMGDKIGIIEGLEVEYGLRPWLGISLGASYAQMGAKFNMIDNSNTSYGFGTYSYKYETTEGSFKCSYVSVPLLLNFHLCKGIAVGTGVQAGFLIKSRISAENNYHDGINGSVAHYSFDPINANTGTLELEDICNKFDWGIPVGLSFEYHNFTLDTRYYFGLKKILKVDNTKNASTSTSNAYNRCLSITLGYKFRVK